MKSLSLALLCLTTGFALAAEGWPTDTGGILYYWGNRADAEMTDRSGETDECRADPIDFGRFSSTQGMDLGDGWFRADERGSLRWRDAAAVTGAFSIACTLNPDGITADTERTVLALVTEGGKTADFSLRQKGSTLIWHSGETDSGPFATLAAGTPTHVVVTSTGSVLQVFANGTSIFEKKLALDPKKWTGKRIFYGTATGAPPYWHGYLEHIVLRDRAQTAAEIAADFAVLQPTLARPQPEHWLIRGKLIEKTEWGEGDVAFDDEYARLVVAYRYEVVAVKKGTYEDKQISVMHWGALDRTPVPSVINREIGKEYDLTLEEVDAHPEVAYEVSRDTTDLDSGVNLIPLYDVTDVGVKGVP